MGFLHVSKKPKLVLVPTMANVFYTGEELEDMVKTTGFYSWCFEGYYVKMDVPWVTDIDAKTTANTPNNLIDDYLDRAEKWLYQRGIG